MKSEARFLFAAVICCLQMFSAIPTAAQTWIPIDGLLADVSDFGKLENPDSTQATPTQDPPAKLTEEELQFAKTAWAYFVANENADTGLVAAVNNFSSTTLWDEGGYLLAMISAVRLGILPREDAKQKLEKVFASLTDIPLFQDRLPNKVYNTKTLKMTDYANKPTPDGVGWSALDIMRLISGMLVVTQEFPELGPNAQAVIDRWDMEVLANEGRFQGIAVRGKSHTSYVQEGRIGYEQYAGVIGLEVGLEVDLASRYLPILRYQKYHDIRIPGDTRTAETHGVSSVTTSEPFLLEALEFGWRPQSIPVARAVYLAQVFRYEKTGQLTSLSEDHIKGKPYFAYNAILVDHVPFISVTSRRDNVSEKRGISTKASFGWWALMQDDYTKKLVETVKHLQSDRGWYAGLFESDQSANEILTMNTNAVVLEALHYKVFGPLYRR